MTTKRIHLNCTMQLDFNKRANHGSIYKIDLTNFPAGVYFLRSEKQILKIHFTELTNNPFAKSQLYLCYSPYWHSAINATT